MAAAANPRLTHQVTHLLQAWRGGDQQALEQLIPLVHSELRRLARRHMRGERPGQTLQPTDEPKDNLVALDQALTAVGAVHPRKAQVVELRYFAGLTVAETAEALKLSPEAVTRDWKLARVWLARELSRQDRVARRKPQAAIPKPSSPNDS